jgi:hypothetical protein
MFDTWTVSLADLTSFSDDYNTALLLYSLTNFGHQLPQTERYRGMIMNDVLRHYPQSSYPWFDKTQKGLACFACRFNLPAQKLQSLQLPLLPVDKDGKVDMLA